MFPMLPYSRRDWEPETGWSPGDTKPTRGHCSPGQHVCFRGATLTCGINSWGRSLWWAVQGLREGWRCRDVPLCLSSSNYLRGGDKTVFLSYRRDVFACIGLPDGDSSWERSYSRWPLGVCDYLVPVHRQFHPEQWADRTRNLYNWSEPHNRCTYTQRAKYTVSLFPDKSIHSTHCDSYRRASSLPWKWNTHILFA